MLSERQTVAGAYQKIESHEELCSERYRALGVEIRDLKDGLKGMQKAAWGVVAGLAAYLLVQVYTDLKTTRSPSIAQAPPSASVVVNPTPPTGAPPADR